MHTVQDKKRLEKALLELQRVNARLLDAASGRDATLRGNASSVHSITAESAALLSELGSRQRPHCPVRSAPLPASAQPDKGEVCIMICSLHTRSAESATLCVARALQYGKVGAFPCVF